MLDYKTAESPENLLAHLGPCIGIGAIYEGKGYLLHTQVGVDYSEVLKPLTEDLIRDVRDKTRLQIYVAGCSIYHEDYVDDDECIDNILEGRKTILDIITKAGFEKAITEVRWAKDGAGQTLYLILGENRGMIEDWEKGEDIDDEHLYK
jgi:hypothetical protein